MLVSVAIPAINRPQLLTEGLQRVVRQPYGDWEVVIIGDGSNPLLSADDIRHVLGERCQLVSHPTNLGVVGTKNAGIHYASGDMCTVRTKQDKCR